MKMNNMEKSKKIIDWRLFSILLGANIFSVIIVLPYTLTLQDFAKVRDKFGR